MLKLSATKLLGTELIRNNGESIKVASCGDSSNSNPTIIGLYFSAHWCPPCRSFTPELITFYKSFNSVPRRHNLEVVFVSADNDEKEFESFFRDMPWCAVPYDDRERRAQLPRKFGVKTIPALILVEADSGRVITTQGRELISDDPQGKEFPWTPRSVQEVLSTTNFMSCCKENVPFSTFKNHIKGLYFSANWCPPCKTFTPQLIEVYEKVRSSGKQFEVVFVSSDRSLDSFEICFGSMPWLAVPYKEDKLRKEFTLLFGVQGIPTLVLLDEENNLITKDGRFEITADMEGKNFPWRPELVNELTEKFGMTLNESPFIIIFSDGDKQEIEACRNLLLPVAEEFSTQDDGIRFFVGGESEVCESLREFAELEDAVPLLVIIDIPEGKCYVLEDDIEITVDVVRTFIDKFRSGQLEARSLKM